MATDRVQTALERFTALAKNKALRVSRGYEIPKPPPGELLDVKAPRPALAPQGVVWVRPGQRIEIYGRTITKGLVFLATSSRAISRMPFAICPGLSITKPGSQAAQQIAGTLPYYPRFDSVSAAARGCLIDWLASDRETLPTETGISFLYFYGLEQCALAPDTSLGDLCDVAAEVARIRGLSVSKSWRRYTGALLDLMQTEIAMRTRDGLANWSVDVQEAEVGCADTRLRIRIAARIQSGGTIPTDELLAFVVRTKVLMSASQKRVWGDHKGLVLRLAAAEIMVEYPNGFTTSDEKPPLGTPQVYNRAAYQGNVEKYGKVLATLPDPDGLDLSGVMNAWQRAMRLAERCVNLKPEEGISGIGVRTEIDKLMVVPVIREFVSWMEQSHAGGGRVPADEFARAVRIEGELTPEWVAKLARFTARFGYQACAEDDSDPVRFVLITRETTRDRVALEKIAADVEALAILRAGGLQQSIALDLLDKMVVKVGGSEQMLRRLRVRFPDVAPPRKARPLSLVRQENRPEIARRLCGHIADARLLGDPDWTRFLEDAFAQAKLDKAELYSLLHAGGRINQGGKLDQKRVAEVTEGTRVVAAALADVFADEDPLPATPDHDRTAPPVVPQAHPAGSVSFPGLDPAHAALLGFLNDQAEISTTAVEAKARSLGLMPRGAVDTINDWAMDSIGEVVIEQIGDRWVVDRGLLLPLLPKQKDDQE